MHQHNPANTKQQISYPPIISHPLRGDPRQGRGLCKALGRRQQSKLRNHPPPPLPRKSAQQNCSFTAHIYHTGSLDVKALTSTWHKVSPTNFLYSSLFALHLQPLQPLVLQRPLFSPKRKAHENKPPSFPPSYKPP